MQNEFFRNTHLENSVLCSCLDPNYLKLIMFKLAGKFKWNSCNLCDYESINLLAINLECFMLFQMIKN